MGTTATPQTETLTPQRGVFDLETMDQVTLYKVVEFKPVSDTKEALDRLGNDANKFLAVINRGLKSEVQNSAVADPSIPWQVQDDEGNFSEFKGTPANMAGVNNLVLSLAKQVFGYTKDAPVEEKRAAKESAIAMIKSNPEIREGLKKTAAAETPETETV